MALKLLVTFLLLISIGGIYSKTLLEKIRDDSDLSQVSFSSKNIFVGFLVAHQRSSVKILLLDSSCRLGEKEAKKKSKQFGFGRKALHNRRRVLCNMSVPVSAVPTRTKCEDCEVSCVTRLSLPMQLIDASGKENSISLTSPRKGFSHQEDVTSKHFTAWSARDRHN